MRTTGTATVLIAALAMAGAAPVATERVVTGDGVVAGSVNGVPGRIRIDPGGTAMPLVTAQLAERAGLKPSMFGVAYGIGPVRIAGHTRVAKLQLGGAPFERRVGWADRPYAPDIDGMIGPAGLPDPVVRFQLRPARPGESTVAFPMIDQGGMFGGWSERFAVITVGGRPMRLRFDPHGRRTLANAGAGLRLAAANGGTLAGDTAMEEIAFGVGRPVRAMRLATPLRLGPLAIAALGVRTSDNGNASGIPAADAPPPDPDEVVVTAKGKRDQSRDRLSLGGDVLGRCSSIVFDKPAKAVRLTCA